MSEVLIVLAFGVTTALFAALMSTLSYRDQKFLHPRLSSGVAGVDSSRANSAPGDSSKH